MDFDSNFVSTESKQYGKRNLIVILFFIKLHILGKNRGNSILGLSVILYVRLYVEPTKTSHKDPFEFLGQENHCS